MSIKNKLKFVSKQAKYLFNFVRSNKLINDQVVFSFSYYIDISCFIHLQYDPVPRAQNYITALLNELLNVKAISYYRVTINAYNYLKFSFAL